MPRAEAQEVDAGAVAARVDEGGAPVVTDSPHVHVVIDVAGDQDALADATEKVRQKGRPVRHRGIDTVIAGVAVTEHSTGICLYTMQDHGCKPALELKRT